jgi:hypothetical protein
MAGGSSVLFDRHDLLGYETYSENMPPRDFQIDEPGFTEMVTFQLLCDMAALSTGPICRTPADRECVRTSG